MELKVDKDGLFDPSYHTLAEMSMPTTRKPVDEKVVNVMSFYALVDFSSFRIGGQNQMLAIQFRKRYYTCQSCTTPELQNGFVFKII